MNGVERFRAAMDLKVPDRVPVAPLLEWYIPVKAGVSTHDFVYDFDKANAAIIKVWEMHGKEIDGTVTFPYECLHTLPFPTSHTMYYFNWDIPKEGISLPQIREYPPLMQLEDYDRIIDEGWASLLRPLPVQDAVRALNDLGRVTEANLEWINVRKVQPLAATYVMPPAELISYARGLNNFALDIYRHRDKIKRLSDFMLQGTIAWGLGGAAAGKVDIIFLYGGRTSSTFLRPDVFEDIAWPHIKTMVETWWANGVRTLLHFDADWEPVYHLFKQLPKRSCILELERSDIFKAKEVLGDTLCLMGNVDSTIMRYGTPEQIEKECKKLIEVCGEGGGFILSSGCEVPLDTPVENVQAMVNAALKYGVY